MDGSREYYAKWNVRERQIPWFHSNAEFKKQTKWAKGKRERDKPRNRLLTTENKLMVTKREVGGGMGEKSDGD